MLESSLSLFQLLVDIVSIQLFLQRLMFYILLSISQLTTVDLDMIFPNYLPTALGLVDEWFLCVCCKTVSSREATFGSLQNLDEDHQGLGNPDTDMQSHPKIERTLFDCNFIQKT